MNICFIKNKIFFKYVFIGVGRGGGVYTASERKNTK